MINQTAIEAAKFKLINIWLLNLRFRSYETRRGVAGQLGPDVSKEGHAFISKELKVGEKFFSKFRHFEKLDRHYQDKQLHIL